VSNFTNTTSNYISGIDSEYPVAGQDNDSQGFRNNFSNISLALTSINGDVTDLQVNTVKINQTNNFGNNLIQQAQFQNCSVAIYDDTATATAGNFTVDYSNGSYQKFYLDRGTHNITLSNLPSSDKSGSLILELTAATTYNTYINFISSSLFNLSSDDLPYQITQDHPFIIEIISDGIGGNLFVKKMNDAILTANTVDINASNVTGTNIYAVTALHINTNSYTVSTDLNTIISNGNLVGKVALLPQQITTTVASVYADVGGASNTTSTFDVVSTSDVIVGAAFSFTGTNTTYTVTAIDGPQITTQPFNFRKSYVTDGDSITFTNPQFPTQPTIAIMSPVVASTTTAQVGDLNGQIHANSSSVYISYADYAPNTTNKIQLPSLNSVKTSIGSAIPQGSIIMWYGASNTVPTGWQICDGTNSTPDLRDKFIVGAGTTYSNGNTGGSANAVVVSHSHSVTDPGHDHTGPTYQYLLKPPYVGSLTGNDMSGSGSEQAVGGGDGGLMITTATNITINSQGVSGTNANLPPYFALFFIMKMS